MVPPELQPASLPQIRHLFVKSATFSTNLQVFLKTLGSWPQSRHWGLGWGDGLGRHFVPPLLAVNSSSFQLVLLNYKRSGSFP